MPLKPFWIKKFHTKLSDRDFNRLLGFDYHTLRTESCLSYIFMKNKQDDSTIAFNFQKIGNQLICVDLAGDGWSFFDNYSIPITTEEAQALLINGELTQTIDVSEMNILTSSIILKDLNGFYGSLHTVQNKDYCSGLVYEPTLTQKLYFVYITIDSSALTATWKLIPIT